jgi:hypothetical protein
MGGTMGRRIAVLRALRLIGVLLSGHTGQPQLDTRALAVGNAEQADIIKSRDQRMSRQTDFSTILVEKPIKMRLKVWKKR